MQCKKEVVMNTIFLDRKPQIGNKIKYKKEIIFKGFEGVASKIVAVFDRHILLENGDTLIYIIK